MLTRILTGQAKFRSTMKVDSQNADFALVSVTNHAVTYLDLALRAAVQLSC